MSVFHPEDEDDALFHARFGGLREVVVRAARGLAQRTKHRVAGVERAAPRFSDVVVSGVVELLNLVARSVGATTDEDDDE